MADLDGDVKSGLTGLTCKLQAERPVGSGMSRTVGKLSAVGAAGTKACAGWEMFTDNAECRVAGDGVAEAVGARSRGAVRPGKDIGFYKSVMGSLGTPPGED